MGWETGWPLTPYVIFPPVFPFSSSFFNIFFEPKSVCPAPPTSLPSHLRLLKIFILCPLFQHSGCTSDKSSIALFPQIHPSCSPGAQWSCALWCHSRWREGSFSRGFHHKWRVPVRKIQNKVCWKSANHNHADRRGCQARREAANQGEKICTLAMQDLLFYVFTVYSI